MVEIITEKLTDGSFIARCSEKYGIVIYGDNEEEIKQTLRDKISYKKLKEELKLTNKEVAEFFGMSYGSFSNSSAKERYEKALCNFFEYLNTRVKT